MRYKLFASVTILAFLAALLPTSVLAAPPPPDYVPFDVGPEIRSWEATPDRIAPISQAELQAGEAAGDAIAAASTTDCITDTKFFLILNDALGTYQVAAFNLMGEGALSQVWVQVNLAWPAGDPRATPVIDCDQVQYMIGQFEGNIYPKEISFFGAPDAHDGASALLPSLLGLPDDYYADTDGRQLILISNVRDANYYDSTYPIYIAGFYSPSFEVYFDRNAMTIDAFDWVDRTGPDSARPFLYEGVFAHEYQHLLHSDYDPDEENFINEGMSDFAMFLVGYTQALQGHLDAAASNPENSLTSWGDQGDLEILTDYGQAALYQLYLYEQYGQTFTQALFHNPDNGISGIQSTLDAFHSHRSFADTFHDWSVAMLLDLKSPGFGRYLFKNLDFKLNIGTPSAPNPEAFNTPGAPPWGTDYIWITGDPHKLGKLTFNGLDYSTFATAWTSDGSVLTSGQGDLLDNWAIFATPGGGTLSFDTTYDTEQYWDFGFVQVSTDGGYTWTSLSNAYTTDLHDPSAHPTVVANLPGLTGAGGPVHMTFSLAPYAGQNILVAFRYVTDWSSFGTGWTIDNVYVDSTLISDGSSTAAFKDITEILPINNNFTVTFVGQKGFGRWAQYKVQTMHLNHNSEDGWIALKSILSWCDTAVMLVSYDAAEGVSFYADYSYELTYRQPKPRPHKPVHGHGNGTHFHRSSFHH